MDGQLVSQKSSNENYPMIFEYNTDGQPIGFVYRNMHYYYLTNQMGDVIGITDANGIGIAYYDYDEWGNLLEIITATEGNTQQMNIAIANPLRYRGYYYDTESGYYYLQSRYYDPSICRFINADMPEFLGIGESLAKWNLFSYCENEPVNNKDVCGYFRISTVVAGFILDAVISFILPYIFTAFKATKLLKWAKMSKWLNSKYNSAIKSLAKALYNGMDTIMYNIMGKAANAATRAFTLSRIQRWLENILTFSVGYGIAYLIDCLDRDGKSGYIRF